jgi:acetyl esterase/lipase
MTMTTDPEVAAALSELAALNGDHPPPSPGGWRAFRETVAATYPVLTANLPRPEVRHQMFTTTAADGRPVDLHWYTPTRIPDRTLARTPAPTPVEATEPGPAVVHAHGGGLVAGSVELLAPFLVRHVAAARVPALSVAYRLLPDPGPGTPHDDVYAGLTWLIQHADELGVDPARIAVMGESAGAGLAAATAVRARDAGLELARQILIYPMLDDRTLAPSPHTEPWDSGLAEICRVAWELLLGDARGTDDVPATLAAARLADHTRMPSAYLEVGDLDLFRDETVRYAAGLWAAGIDAELHVLPGLMHGWDHYAPRSSTFADVFARRTSVLKSL